MSVVLIDGKGFVGSRLKRDTDFSFRVIDLKDSSINYLDIR